MIKYGLFYIACLWTLITNPLVSRINITRAAWKSKRARRVLNKYYEKTLR